MAGSWTPRPGVAHGGTLDAVEALRISEERHRVIAENALDVIWTMAPDGSITHVSPSVEQLRGFTVAEAMAQPLDEILTPASAAVSYGYFVAMLGEIAAGRRPDNFRGEFEYRCKDGSTVWTDVLAYPILNADGALVELLGVSRDLSTTKRHELELLAARDETEAAIRALRTSNIELGEAQRLAHAGSWTLKLNTGAITWSDELHRIFGQAPGTPVPPFSAVESRYDDATLERRDALYRRTIETGEPWDVEYDIVQPDGATRRVAARGEAVRDEAGVVAELRGTLLDVTELRAAQERVQQGLRMELVGRLAGGVAHEFNNLNAAILGYAHLLATSFSPSDPRLADAEAIQQAARGAAALTARLLAFGRRQLLRRETLDLADVVMGMLPVLQTLAGDSVSLVADMPAGRLMVWADRRQLEEALANLVLNAHEAIEDGGLIRISTGTETIAADDGRLHQPVEPGPYVRLAVTDTGRGIAPDVLQHVFEPFFTTQPTGQATGLGLSAVEGSIAQSGGFVTAESTLGSGSVFAIFLPRLPADA